MIRALRVANFKAFGASQRIPLRPITLIFGANSAGKSSLLHALALAHHAIETGELDTQRTLGGESIDLGGFRQYVHRRERERQVELSFEFVPSQVPGAGALPDRLRSAREAVVKLAIGTTVAHDRPTLDGAEDRDPDCAGDVRVERFSLEMDGDSLLSMSVRPGGFLRLDNLNSNHPLLRKVFRDVLGLALQEMREEHVEKLSEVLTGLVPGISARRRRLIPEIEPVPESWMGPALLPALLVGTGRDPDDVWNAMRLFLPGLLRDLVGGLGVALEKEVRRLRYLGPLRSYPPRHLTFSQHHAPNWFAGGGHAWDIVRRSEEVRQRVNAWLGDASRLKTPYTLEVRDLLPAAALSGELPPKLAKALYRWVAALVGQEDLAKVVSDLATGQGVMIDPAAAEEVLPEIEDLVSATMDTEAVTEQWKREIVQSRPEVLQDLVLIDQRTGTVVSHRDVGIGVSQVLPVLVSAYASKQLLLAIEQPEIHLHPALQAELGDVFIESALRESRNTFLIETHSEHLLLRIMRRIRETSAGELPPGLPEIRPDDVMVLFVEPDGSQSIVREMPLNERGELVKAWPGGFFEEGLREIF